jgi:PPOX class probable FMN-dependent enzyme
MSTVGNAGTDASPRGDIGPVVRIIDEKTLHMPDWRGNNRIDSLRNIVEDGRISLMFMVSGVNDVVRVNGTAKITASKILRESYAHEGHLPTCVLIISLDEVYVHCPKSMMRSDFWNTEGTVEVPTIGSILKEVTATAVGGVDFDKDLSKRIKKTLWS